jgi:outer membrane lipopolysaccharide assembly protein LptE/RlpB
MLPFGTVSGTVNRAASVLSFIPSLLPSSGRAMLNDSSALSSVFSVLLSFLALSTVGCGYAFEGSGSILPADIKTIAIPMAENDTTEAGLSQRFTEALRSRFDRYGAVKVVKDVSSADVVLLARIVDVDTKVSGVTSETDIELDSDLTMSVGAELRRRSGQILYRNPSMKISDNFAKTGQTVITSSSAFAQSGIQSSNLDNLGDREIAREQGDQALSNLLEEAARRIYMEAVAADF